jgi:nicotinate-nucleotide--dimethylbenzimidazole phosphoribosyltransferase
MLAADNGVTAQGIAATPAEITVTMASFMAEHRSSACIMAAYSATDVALVDMGMFRSLDVPGIVDRHIAWGTGDISRGPAMTAEQGARALRAGIDLVRDASEKGYRLIATGEMGIGNTTSSSAVAAVLLRKTVPEVTGRGAGLSDEALEHKIRIIEQAIELNAPDPQDAFDVLCKLGGFDIAGLCGLFLGGALYGIPVIIDGFISAIAALIAVRLCPASSYALLPSHISVEPAAILVLDELGLTPIIHAGMRLGEGTGAVALIPLLDQAAAVYHNLMTFADIGM